MAYRIMESESGSGSTSGGVTAAQLAAKADKTELLPLASKTEVAAKADKTELNKKADKTYTDDELAKKVKKSDKGDITDVDAATVDKWVDAKVLNESLTRQGGFFLGKVSKLSPIPKRTDGTDAGDNDLIALTAKDGTNEPGFYQLSGGAFSKISANATPAPGVILEQGDTLPTTTPKRTDGADALEGDWFILLKKDGTNKPGYYKVDASGSLVFNKEVAASETSGVYIGVGAILPDPAPNRIDGSPSRPGDWYELAFADGANLPGRYIVDANNKLVINSPSKSGSKLIGAGPVPLTKAEVIAEQSFPGDMYIVTETISINGVITRSGLYRVDPNGDLVLDTPMNFHNTTWLEVQGTVNASLGGKYIIKPGATINLPPITTQEGAEILLATKTTWRDTPFSIVTNDLFNDTGVTYPNNNGDIIFLVSDMFLKEWSIHTSGEVKAAFAVEGGTIDPGKKPPPI